MRNLYKFSVCVGIIVKVLDGRFLSTDWFTLYITYAKLYKTKIIFSW